MPTCDKRFLAVNLDPSRRNSGDSLRPRQLIGFRLTMAAAVLQNQDATRAAVEELYNFLETFAALGASGLVTVADVYIRMRETGLPTGYIEPYTENTDPTTTAPTGKTNFD